MCQSTLMDESRTISTSLSRLMYETNEPASFSATFRFSSAEDINNSNLAQKPTLFDQEQQQQSQQQQQQPTSPIERETFRHLSISQIPASESYTSYLAAFPPRAKLTANYRFLNNASDSHNFLRSSSHLKNNNMFPLPTRMDIEQQLSISCMSQINSHVVEQVLQETSENKCSGGCKVDLRRLFSGLKVLPQAWQSHSTDESMNVGSNTKRKLKSSGGVNTSNNNNNNISGFSNAHEIPSEEGTFSQDILYGMTSCIETKSLLRRSNWERIPSRIKALDQQKVILFLEGKYQALKFFGSPRHPVEGISYDLFSAVDELIQDTSMQTKIFLPIQQRKYKAKMEEKAASDNTGATMSTSRSRKRTKRRQVFHNLSKYMMHLILELLNEVHLNAFGILGRFAGDVSDAVRQLRECGKRSDLSQTFFYNHAHYNAAFLAITETNRAQILASNEMRDMHTRMFGEFDYFDPMAVLHVNMVKRILATIVSMQLEFIIQTLKERYDVAKLFAINNLNSDCQAKVHYMINVFHAIDLLQQGEMLIRF